MAHINANEWATYAVNVFAETEIPQWEAADNNSGHSRFKQGGFLTLDGIVRTG